MKYESYPPLPPNCNFFRSGKNAKLEDEVWFLAPHKPFETPNSCGPSFEYIEMNDRLWREVIAAIARCAWLDEAERRFNEWPSDEKAACLEMNAEFDNVSEAKKNAEAWRQWGEGRWI